MKNNSPSIQLNNISYEVSRKTIISEFNMNLSTGEFVGIIGPNGAGKSTLLKLITSIIKPSTGNILLNDLDISEYKPKELNKIISYLPQNISYNFPFKVLELVLMGRYPHLGRLQNENSNDIEIANKSLQLVDMESFEERNILNLSGGEQQRVSIARVLSQNSDFIFLDEPISSLDINHQLSILKLLRSKSDQGKGVYAVLHDIRLAFDYCKKVIIMDKGQVVAEGTPEDILNEELISSVFKVKTSITRNSFGKNKIELVN